MQKYLFFADTNDRIKSQYKSILKYFCYNLLLLNFFVPILNIKTV